MTFDARYAIVTASDSGIGSLLVDTSYDDWRRVIATNLDGTFISCVKLRSTW